MKHEITPEQIIEHFQMKPLAGEGGLFYQAYISDEIFAEGVLPGRSGPHPYGSAILYLLTGQAISRMHRLASDEIFHFYLGDPCEQFLLAPDGTGSLLRLGSDLLAGEQVQQLVPRGYWQGTRLAPGSRWALLGTTMAPGYTQADYEDGDLLALTEEYPAFADELTVFAAEARYE